MEHGGEEAVVSEDYISKSFLSKSRGQCSWAQLSGIKELSEKGHNIIAITFLSGSIDHH